MEQLQVAFGCAARDALCAALDAAHTRIDAEFYSVSDPAVIASLNAAAARNVEVNVHVEGNPARFGRAPDTGEKPDVVRTSSAIAKLRGEFVDGVHLVVEQHPDTLVHGKAAVVDRRVALISTANPTICGFESPGEVLVSDTSANDIAAVEASIAGTESIPGDYVVTGPATLIRSRINHLMGAQSDLRIATEDLSDAAVVNALVVRSAGGHHDQVLLEADCRVSRSQYQALTQLRNASVDVRTLPSGYMHEKYIDAGDEIYVGSANLTR
ncbi:MAG TPA: phospholipase D-like domain-containing protein, partial [Candidatus Eremiobacteraceae bacterium]|nr:phospholipase D-like domain-containing protein [Candidatus Eremiobacteraceae bacterium]